MIKITLYGDTKEINEKPTSFVELCQIVSKLHKLENPYKFTYEYLCSNNKYYPLDSDKYKNFLIKENVKEILLHLSPAEANYQLNENNTENDNKIIYNTVNETEPNKIRLEEEDEEDSDSNEEKEDSNDEKKMSDNIEKIKIQKVKVKEKEKEKRKKKLEIDKKKKEKRVKKPKEINYLNHQIKNLLSAQLKKITTEIINASSVQFSQIIKNSNINQEIEENPISDSIESHKAISCNGCGTCPILGNRYKCVYCDEVDFCENCEKESGNIHNHPLYKLRFVIN